MKAAICLRAMLTAFALIMAPTAALAETIAIFGDEAYAPTIYLNKGAPAGVLPAILGHLSAKTGDTYALVLHPWRRALAESERGLGGIVGLSWNKERDSQYDYSEALYFDDIQLVVTKGKVFTFNEIADLKGHLIGGHAGASYGEAVDRLITSGVLTVERDYSQVSRLKKLLAGRIDVALIGNGTAGYAALLASDPELSAQRNRFVVLPHPLVHDPLYLAFAKSMKMKPALARFNRALEAFKLTPEYRRIIAGEP